MMKLLVFAARKRRGDLQAKTIEHPNIERKECRRFPGFNSMLGVRCWMFDLWLRRKARHDYLVAFTIAMPHGPLPALIRFNSLRAFTSITDTSSDAPLAV